MLLGEAQTAHAQQIVGHHTQKMACHQMLVTQAASGQTPDTHTTESSHHMCTHCVACILVIASAHANTAPILAAKLRNIAITGIEHFYFSRDLSPTTKPPIHLS